MNNFHTIWLLPLGTENTDMGFETVAPRCDVCSKRGCVRKNHSATERVVSTFCKEKIGNKSKREREIWDAHWEEVYQNPLASATVEDADGEDSDAQ